MKRAYITPDLDVYGDVHRITGIFGSQQIQDVLVDPNGNIEETGTGSINACPTQNPVPGETCIIEQ